MTKKELREHCEKQIKACEMWAKNRGQEPSGKVYEEHKLVLDLIKSMDKLENIEQIVSDYGLTNVNLLSNDLSDFEKDILREVLEQE